MVYIYFILFRLEFSFDLYFSSAKNSNRRIGAFHLLSRPEADVDGDGGNSGNSNLPSLRPLRCFISLLCAFIFRYVINGIPHQVEYIEASGGGIFPFSYFSVFPFFRHSVCFSDISSMSGSAMQLLFVAAFEKRRLRICLTVAAYAN